MNTNQIHIFFVDDDEDYSFLIEQALDEIGIAVKLSTAYNGIEALNFLSNGEVIPDMIMLDINMPMMDGLTALEQIRTKEIYKNVPVIIFSTTEDPNTVNEAYRLGATLYLRKPDQYADYLLIIKSLLTGSNIPGTKNELFVRRG